MNVVNAARVLFAKVQFGVPWNLRSRIWPALDDAMAGMAASLCGGRSTLFTFVVAWWRGSEASCLWVFRIHQVSLKDHTVCVCVVNIDQLFHCWMLYLPSRCFVTKGVLLKTRDLQASGQVHKILVARLHSQKIYAVPRRCQNFAR